MGLIERLKNFFYKNKIKSLPEPSVNEKHSQRADNSWIIGNENGYLQEPLTKIDADIINFLSAYYQNVSQVDIYAPINNYRVAYASLVQSNEQITQDQYNYNHMRENEFLTNLAINNRYQLNEENGFYHVQSQNYQMPNFQDMARIYVSCKSENISDLAQMISEFNTNPNFYMKFVSNESNTQIPRNEKIVIYCDKTEVDYTLRLIQNCRIAKPDFFTDSQGLPFLKSQQGIATVAYQPITNQYTNLHGQTKQIPQSINAFIASMLQESYLESVREIARVDSNLNFLFDENNYSNETLYVQNFPYALQTNGSYLLKSMKAKLEVLSKKNNVRIEGLSQENQYNMNTERESSELFK